MAERLAVIAIVSSIIQLVDFTSKVISRLNDVQSGSNDIPKSLGHLKTELPVLLQTLEQIHEAIRVERFSKEHAAALLPTVQACDQSIRDIELILAKTLPMQGDGRAKKVLKSVGSVRNEGKIESITMALRNYIGTLTFYFTASSSILQPLTDEKLIKVREWLSAPDPSINFDKSLELREANTGLWLLEGDFYKRWMTNASLVWLHGIPGCGKTILSSTVLENVLEKNKKDAGKAVAYFYFDFTDPQKQDPKLMIHSLISQLSQQCIKISPSLDEFYSSYKSRQSQPSLDALLNALQDLMSIIQKIHAWQAKGLHVLFTSRIKGEIKTTMERILSDQNILYIQTETVDSDIELYVHQRLLHDGNLQKWHADDAIRQRIERALTEKAHGMFRLAACQLDIFGACRNRKQLWNALETLPPDLDGTYNRILGTIKSDDMPYALRILRWLTFSSRPLLLAEVAEVAALDADRYPAFDRDEVLEDHFDVLSICSSLVTLVASNSVKGPSDSPQGPLVLLAHYSVKEYLVSERILESQAKLYRMESKLCHQIITKCCLQYLLMFDSSDALTGSTLKKFALAKYSAQHWVTHSRANAEYDSEPADLTIKLLNEEGAAFLTWIRLHNPDRLLHGTDFNRSLATIGNPLYYASQAGLADVARRLITETSADVNAQGGVFSHALQAASLNGHLKTVQLLIEKGSEINYSQGRLYGSALQAASYGGHLEVVRFLIEKGAEVNAQCGTFGNALQGASVGGHLNIVQVLIEKGAEVNAKGGSFGTALQAASYMRSSLNVVQFLIEKGAEVNAKGGHFGNALQGASTRGELEIVRFLIDKGAEINAQGGHFGNALQGACASTRGELEVVQFLIEKGAEVNAEGGHFGDALQAASSRGRLDVVQFLLEKGALHKSTV